ncbi:MAG: 5-formyltetrahydrofolate cyclo-ligase [Methanomicrobiales archaeon]|nr:5-formyltetrahydrofolate cyclo-ligase [Methanomicrobiales archaeon]
MQNEEEPSKEELRDRARVARSGLTADEVRSFSGSICNSLHQGLNGEETVMVYVSKPAEVDTMPLIRHLLQKGVRVVVPIIERETRTLRLSCLKDPDDLVISTFFVPEPIGNEIPVRGEELEVIIVPLLAFDRTGHRLGYGAGYYDRFLSLYPQAKKIGAAFSCQEIRSVPADDNDVAMDMIVTERESISCR